MSDSNLHGKSLAFSAADRDTIRPNLKQKETQRKSRKIHFSLSLELPEENLRIFLSSVKSVFKKSTKSTYRNKVIRVSVRLKYSVSPDAFGADSRSQLCDIIDFTPHAHTCKCKVGVVLTWLYISLAQPQPGSRERTNEIRSVSEHH